MTSKNYCKMETAIMKHYPKCTPQSILNLNNDILRMKKEMETLVQQTQEEFLFLQIKDIVENHYDLGTLVDAYQIFGGYINTSFGLYTEKNGETETWFFRKYKRGKELDALLFEHSMLSHAKEQGFSYGAVPIKGNNGKTYHVEKQIMDEGEEDFYFAIFNFIGGTVKYDWIPNWANDGVKDITVTSAAKSMAEFHNTTKDFDPQGRHGDNIMDNEDITVNDIMKKFPKTLKGYREAYRKAGFENVYTEFFDANYDYLAKMSQVSVIPDEDYKQMVSNVCHSDFHPGNFKYTEEGEICGSFDYDMAKVDARLFEIGLALHYCFSSWESENNGVMKLERVKLFIDTYNEALAKTGGLAPLNQTEKKYLYEAMIQGTLYANGWCCAACYYNTELDPYEYLYYSQHFTKSLRWLQEHEAEIREISKGL